MRGIFLYFYFFVDIFGGLQCDGNFVANAAHYMIVGISGFEPRELAVTSRRSTNLAIHPLHICILYLYTYACVKYIRE